jgi:hypothetical protein
MCSISQSQAVSARFALICIKHGLLKLRGRQILLLLRAEEAPIDRFPIQATKSLEDGADVAGTDGVQGDYGAVLQRLACRDFARPLPGTQSIM